eukprot:jgi/Botrbrau1/1491/Bobra.178_3s0046.1
MRMQLLLPDNRSAARFADAVQSFDGNNVRILGNLRQAIRPFTAGKLIKRAFKRHGNVWPVCTHLDPRTFSRPNAKDSGPQGQKPSPSTLSSITEASQPPAQASRRMALFATSLGLWSVAQQCSSSSAHAEPLTLADVTPAVAPAGPLTSREQAIISIFEANTYSTVNVFDITLQGNAKPVGVVDAPEGNGTGFVWDKAGHVVTNYHVLGNVLKQLPASARAPGARPPVVARVVLLGTDGYTQTREAVLVGADRSKDLAVLQINAPEESLRPVKLGSSSSLKVGAQVLAIGNPFGFDHTLTSGIVSGLGREIQSQVGSVIAGGIQTDAAINPGNSGGPLLDSQGRVVGVNTAIFTNTGTSAGVGFAIPIDTVSRLVPQLIQYGRAVRPTLNVQLASDQVAAALKVRTGALIQSVAANSAAAKAGLLPTRRGLSGVLAGDVIIGLDNRVIKRPSDIITALDDYKAGDKVQLRILRGDGDPKELTISLLLEEEASA